MFDITLVTADLTFESTAARSPITVKQLAEFHHPVVVQSPEVVLYHVCNCLKAASALAVDCCEVADCEVAISAKPSTQHRETSERRIVSFVKVERRA